MTWFGPSLAAVRLIADYPNVIQSKLRSHCATSVCGVAPPLRCMESAGRMHAARPAAGLMRSGCTPGMQNQAYDSER